jgi:hypothetical protein
VSIQTGYKIQTTLHLMDFNKRDPTSWDKCQLMELMNENEIHEFIEWEYDPDQLWGATTWQQKAVEILKDALKREMLNENVDWIRVHGYITACPALCEEKWDEDAKDD